jgi:hypothetical protein
MKLFIKPLVDTILTECVHNLYAQKPWSAMIHLQAVVTSKLSYASPTGGLVDIHKFSWPRTSRDIPATSYQVRIPLCFSPDKGQLSVTKQIINCLATFCAIPSTCCKWCYHLNVAHITSSVHVPKYMQLPVQIAALSDSNFMILMLYNDIIMVAWGRSHVSVF